MIDLPNELDRVASEMSDEFESGLRSDMISLHDIIDMLRLLASRIRSKEENKK